MMDTLTDMVIAKLKTGSIKNVYLFSDIDTNPKPPYVVVKTESGVMDNTRQYRIIVHFETGYANEMEQYTFYELKELLNCVLSGDNGERHRLYCNGYTDILPEPTDDTYFMERLFYTPLLHS